MTAQKYVDAYGLTRTQFRTLLNERQNNTCTWCGEPLGKNWLHSKDLSTDHVIPRARPHCGPDSLDNVELLHVSCNQEKGAECEGCAGCIEPLEVELDCGQVP